MECISRLTPFASRASAGGRILFQKLPEAVCIAGLQEFETTTIGFHGYLLPPDSLALLTNYRIPFLLVKKND